MIKSCQMPCSFQNFALHSTYTSIHSLASNNQFNDYVLLNDKTNPS